MAYSGNETTRKVNKMNFNPMTPEELNNKLTKEKPVFQIVLLFAEDPMIPFEEDRMRILGETFGTIEKTKDHETMFGYTRGP